MHGDIWQVGQSRRGLGGHRPAQMDVEIGIGRSHGLDQIGVEPFGYGTDITDPDRPVAQLAGQETGQAGFVRVIADEVAGIGAVADQFDRASGCVFVMEILRRDHHPVGGVNHLFFKFQHRLIRIRETGNFVHAIEGDLVLRRQVAHEVPPIGMLDDDMGAAGGADLVDKRVEMIDPCPDRGWWDRAGIGLGATHPACREPKDMQVRPNLSGRAAA